MSWVVGFGRKSAACQGFSVTRPSEPLVTPFPCTRTRRLSEQAGVPAGRTAAGVEVSPSRVRSTSAPAPPPPDSRNSYRREQTRYYNHRIWRVCPVRSQAPAGRWDVVGKTPPPKPAGASSCPRPPICARLAGTIPPRGSQAHQYSGSAYRQGDIGVTVGTPGTDPPAAAPGEAPHCGYGAALPKAGGAETPHALIC